MKTATLFFVLSKKLIKAIYNNIVNTICKWKQSLWTLKLVRLMNFRLTLADILNLKDFNKNLTLANLGIYYTWRNAKSAHNNNTFKISARTWNDEFNFPDGSYSISDIQYYFEYVIRNMKL